MGRKILFYVGILVLVFLAISFFITVKVDQGSNFIVETPLLGVLIFYNPFILALYILIAVVLIIRFRK